MLTGPSPKFNGTRDILAYDLVYLRFSHSVSIGNAYCLLVDVRGGGLRSSMFLLIP